MSQIEGTPEKFSVTYEDLINDVQVGSYILLDDGLVELQVKDIDKTKGEVKCDILNTGELKKKGVNLPGVKLIYLVLLIKMLTISYLVSKKMLIISQQALYVVLVMF